MAKTKTTAKALANRSRLRTGGRPCMTCANTEVREFILAYLAEVEKIPDARPDIGGVLLDHLRDEMGYTLGESGLRRHVRQCPGVRDVWRRVRKHG